MKLAVFDYDGTLFQKQTIPYLMSKWKQLGYPDGKYYLTMSKMLPYYVYFLINKNDKSVCSSFRNYSLKKFMENFKGKDTKYIDDYFYKVCEGIEDNFRKSVLGEIENKKAQGYELVFLSGAYDLLLKNIGDNLGFNKVIGTEINFDSSNIYRNSLNIVSGYNKYEKLLEQYSESDIRCKESFAYGDSITDLQILEAVGNPVAVNPDQELRKIADERGWNIIDE